MLFALVGLLSSCLLQADNRIVVHLTHAPENLIDEVKEEIRKEKVEKMKHIDSKKPSQICKQMLKGALFKTLKPNLSGFVSIYGGYLDISDPDGLISFPLRHVSKKVYIAITPEIKLVKVKGNTFSHRKFHVAPKNPTKLYLFEKKEDEQKQWYWDVQEIDLPKDNTINPITIVIFSKPKNIYVIPGHYLAMQNPQLVLPNALHVVGASNKQKTLLKMIDIKRFFERIDSKKKKVNEKTVQKLITNI